VVADLAAGILLLAACTSTTASFPQPSVANPPTESVTTQVPSTQSVPLNPGGGLSAAQCAKLKKPGGRPRAFRGSDTPRRYCAVVWHSDVRPDCAALAYGPSVIRFLRRHRCGTVRRVVATVYAPGFVVDVSSVATKISGPSPIGEYGSELRFTQLAGSRSAGGIADLLRDGHKIPGPHGRPPAGAYFSLNSLDDQVDMIYAWYVKRPMNARSWNSLKQFEADIAFTVLTT
jgi:hypothetical protein